MIEKYLNYIKYTRDYSKYTLIRYRKWLKKFESFLEKIWKTLERPEEIELIDAYEFIADMKKNWLKWWSVNAVLWWVKGYLMFAKNILEMNVIEAWKIKYCKRERPEIWFFNKEQKSQILNAVNEWVWGREIVQLRNKLLTYILMQTWLRCYEIAKIKVEEIWEDLTVLGKWWKVRHVFLREELLDMIHEYLEKRKRKSEYLFDGSISGHLREWSIRNIFHKMTKSLWIRIHAHKFRHTFATDILHIPWCSVYDAAVLLGHSKITTTQIYLWVDRENLKNLQFKLDF